MRCTAHHSAHTDHVDEPEFPPLLDVASLTIAELREMAKDNPALDRALERILESLDDPNGVISAFGSFIADS